LELSTNECFVVDSFYSGFVRPKDEGEAAVAVEEEEIEKNRHRS
jgi:hypothetical protein